MTAFALSLVTVCGALFVSTENLPNGFAAPASGVDGAGKSPRVTSSSTLSFCASSMLLLDSFMILATLTVLYFLVPW